MKNSSDNNSNIYKELLRGSGKRIKDSFGAVPVVTEGVIRTLRTADMRPKNSSHATHELTYVRSGEMKYFMHGRSYTLKTSDIFIIKPGVEHSYMVVSDKLDLVVVYFAFADRYSYEEGGAYYTNISSTSIDDFLDYATNADPGADREPGFFLYGKGKIELARVAERCVLESEGDAFGKELMMQALSLELVLMVARTVKTSWEASLRVKYGKAGELVHIAKEYIEDHYADGITVADVSAYVFLSPGYFARAFREELGVSPMTYLSLCRIKGACKLLAETDLKVATIASNVGFASPQRFNAGFRKIMKMSPMDYRRNASENG